MTLNYEAIHGLDFNNEEIADCITLGGLLSLELEFTRKCNLKCIYCYSSAGKELEDECSMEEIKDVIDQAYELGAKKIILLGGGEPLMYEGLPEVVEYIYSKGLKQIIFTNGMLLTRALAEFLFNSQVAVVVKHNSNIPEIQDKLAGIKGAYTKIQQGFEYLLAAGYPCSKTQLGIQTVICRQNLKEIPQMWTWARERGIIPYFEILTNQGRAKKHKELHVSNEEIKKIFDELEHIDINKFGHKWSPHPTIASFTCKRHLYSCLVNSQGYIQPCTGVDMAVGNIKTERLAQILKKSAVIQNLRNIYANIEGECKECKFTSDCYGCRGNAYQTTGNYLAADPACWLNDKDTNSLPVQLRQTSSKKKCVSDISSAEDNQEYDRIVSCKDGR